MSGRTSLLGDGSGMGRDPSREKVSSEARKCGFLSEGMTLTGRESEIEVVMLGGRMRCQPLSAERNPSDLPSRGRRKKLAKQVLQSVYCINTRGIVSSRRRRSVIVYADDQVNPPRSITDQPHQAISSALNPGPSPSSLPSFSSSVEVHVPPVKRIQPGSSEPGEQRSDKHGVRSARS